MLKIDVSKLSYGKVVEALRRTRWEAKAFFSENGRVVLDCSPA